MKPNATVEQKILQCVDEGLQILGESGRKAIYYCLENDFKLKRKDIPRKPEAFCKGLSKIFGKEGASIIRRRIIKNLGLIFHLNWSFQTTFSKVVNEIVMGVHLPSE